jgi:hypothetical protein
MIFGCCTTQTPQPLIWLARSEISSTVVAGTPARWTNLPSDCSVSSAGEQERGVRQPGLGDHGVHGRCLLAGHTGGRWWVYAMTRQPQEM